MKQNTCCKALLVLVLSLVMMLGLAVVSAAAVDANGDHVCDSTPCLVCDVAAKINALPDAANITVDNAAAVTEQIHAIDRVKMDLTDEQYDELLTVVARRSSGSGGLDEPARYMEAVEKVVSLNAGGSLYITKSYSVGSTQLDWAQTDATLTIESLDAASTFAPLSVTLSDIDNLSALVDHGLYSATADGWTNCYILPAGTYKITETGYNAVTTSGATLTTTASYSVDGNAVSTDYAEVTVQNDGSCEVMVGNIYNPLSYNLWVGGVEVTEQNADDVLGDGGTVSYAPDANTLTLSDFSYDGPEIGIASDVDLTIKLIGENNTITSTNNSGIEVTGAVTIVGGGTLTVSGDKYGILGGGSVTINGGAKVSANANDTDGVAICAAPSVSTGESTIIISGANTEVNAGCHTGLKATTVNILDNCTVEINATTTAINCTTLNLNDDVEHGGSLWYQWVDANRLTVPSKAERYSHSISYSSLKIEPRSNDYYVVIFMNETSQWGWSTCPVGGRLGIGGWNDLPPAPTGYPEGSMFFRWVTSEGEWIYHGMQLNEDKVAYATWKQPIAGTVTFSGDPVVGETLRAEAHITTNVPYLNYQWLLIEGENKMAIRGANSDTYTPTSDDVGKLLACAVSCPEAAPSSIIAEAGIVRGSGSGGYYPIYIPTAPQQSTELVTSPETFDSGIATSVVLTLLAATGTAWLGKKKD